MADLCDEDLRVAKRRPRGEPAIMQSTTRKDKIQEREYMKTLAKEFSHAYRGQKQKLEAGEVCMCTWRRPDRWSLAREATKASPARIIRLGRGTADIVFCDGDCERESQVDLKYLTLLGSSVHTRSQRLIDLAERWKVPEKIAPEAKSLKKKLTKPPAEADKWDGDFVRDSLATSFAQGRFVPGWDSLNESRRLGRTGGGGSSSNVSTRREGAGGAVAGGGSGAGGRLVSSRSAPSSQAYTPGSSTMSMSQALSGFAGSDSSDSDSEDEETKAMKNLSLEGLGLEQMGLDISKIDAEMMGQVVVENPAVLGHWWGKSRRDSVEGRPQKRNQAYVKVASKVMEWDSIVSKVPIMLAECAFEYRNAGLHRERQIAFQKATNQMRRGWETALECIDTIVAWRAAFPPPDLDHQRRVIDPGPPPEFMWGGKNFLLALVSHWDWLAECPELLDWYGLEFPFTRNPFLRGVGLDERVATPRSNVRRVIVGGVERDVVSDILTKRREEDMVHYRAMEAKIGRGAPWWPAVGIDGETIARVRAAEKLLKAEEEFYPVVQPERGVYRDLEA
jgi:hypothetical protein